MYALVCYIEIPLMHIEKCQVVQNSGPAESMNFPFVRSQVLGQDWREQIGLNVLDVLFLEHFSMQGSIDESRVG